MHKLNYKTYSSITFINNSKWNEYVLRSPFASIYYRFEFLKAIEEGTNFKPRHIVIKKDGNIIGILPNFIQNIPGLPFKLLFSMDPGYGGPLISKHEQKILPLMMDQLKKICSKRVLSHYIRTNHPGFIRYHQFLINNGYKLNMRYSHATIPLKNRSYQEIYDSYSSSKKHEIKKMKKENIEIYDQEITQETLHEFHIGYKETMDRVRGTAYPEKLLLKLHEYLPDRLKLTLVTLDDENIGQHLHFLDNERNSLTAWIINIKREHFKYYPSTLVYDHSIQWALRHNYNTFDMGYSLADFNDGIFNFKQEFGTKQQPILQWEKSYSPIPLNLIKKGGKIYNKLKSKH